MSSKYIASATIIILVAVAAGLFLKTPASGVMGDIETASTTPVFVATTTANGASTVSKDDIVSLPTPPDFRVVIKYSANISPEAKAIIETKAKILEDKLGANSFDLTAWTDLGTLRKMAGDYKGAETAWVFITKAAPAHPTAYANLADLYMNFLKDYPKADAMYKKVIALSPDAVDAYISESLLYESFYKAGGNPEVVLKSGLAANKNSIELNLALARYYTRTGRTADAKEAYQKAVDIAETSGNAALAAQIKAEAGL